MNNSVRKLSSLVSAAFLVFSAAAAAAENAPSSNVPATPSAPASHLASPPFMAVVSGTVISSAEFDAAANEAARQKFYHGKPPEGAIEQLMRDVADGLIDRVLLVDEIKRQGLKPDTKTVDAKIAEYEKRYASSPRWQQERERILPSLRQRLEQDDMLAALESRTRKLPAPTEEQVRAYYRANPDKFTEPEKMALSLILLPVEPSAPESAWKAAETEAGALRMQLSEGADFATLAKKHSTHESAKTGGSLGYLHRGMLPEGIQEKIDEMKPGDLSAPTRILQGYAVFRYDALQKPKHHELATVRERATDLLRREQSDNAWKDFVAGLRKKAKIELNTQRYPALAAEKAAAK